MFNKIQRLCLWPCILLNLSLQTSRGAEQSSPPVPDGQLPLPAHLLAEASKPNPAPAAGASGAPAPAASQMPKSGQALAPMPGDSQAVTSALLPPPSAVNAAELPPMGDLPPPTPQPAAEKPSQNVTINLINKLVERGVLTHADAELLIQQAVADAARARSEAEAEAALLPVGGDAVRVAYVPDSVKSQIRDEIKAEVMATAKEQNWASPRQFPDWTQRITWYGDIRTRAEGIFFQEGNDNTGAFPNFNEINTGAPFDVSGFVFSPQINVDAERQRMRLRARIGMDVLMESGFTAGVRLATGANNSPVSVNQSLGAAGNGQGGNFSKYSLWLDRAYLRWEAANKPRVATAPSAPVPVAPSGKEAEGGVQPVPETPAVVVKHDREWSIAFLSGRFDNPFFVGSDIVWDNDVGMDGVALQGRFEIFKGVMPFFNGGIFPVFTTDFNFASNNPSKFESSDKWLYGIQGGLDLKPLKKVRAKVSAAMFDYDRVEGRLSTPFIPLTNQDAGDTDHTRPTFAQKGNTYRPLRDIIASPLNDGGTSSQYQYFGLATPFNVMNYSARIDLDFFEPFQVSFLGDYAVNEDFDREAINAIAVNNRGPDGEDGSLGGFAGGDTAWSVTCLVGKPQFEKFGDWAAWFGYRYVESDAVIDGFADSQFGFGGTNHKGYTVGANFAISRSVTIGVRWMGATEVAGPPLRNDIVFFDLSAKF